MITADQVIDSLRDHYVESIDMVGADTITARCRCGRFLIRADEVLAVNTAIYHLALQLDDVPPDAAERMAAVFIDHHLTGDGRPVCACGRRFQTVPNYSRHLATLIAGALNTQPAA